MAALTSPQRQEVRSELAQELSGENETTGAMTKIDMLAAVDALDQKITDTASEFNTALPLPARTEMTTSQKARMFSIILRKRFVEGV